MSRRNTGEKISIRIALIFLVSAMFITFPSAVTAQNQYNGEEVFVTADKMPAFPGGEAALRESVYKNLKYPASAKENGIEGKVFVKFIVTKDGSVANVTVTRSVDQSLDNEAVRIVKLLPKFQPGMKDGKTVNVWYSMPISFQMNVMKKVCQS